METAQKNKDKVNRERTKVGFPPHKPIKGQIKNKTANCLVPQYKGVSFDHLLSKEGLWDKYYMGAPKRHMRSA